MSYNKINGGEAWADTSVVHNNLLLRFICRSFPVGPSPLNIHAGDYWNSPATAIVLKCVCVCECVVWGYQSFVAAVYELSHICVFAGNIHCKWTDLILKTPSWQHATLCLYFCLLWEERYYASSKAEIWNLRRRHHFTECLGGARLVRLFCPKLWGYWDTAEVKPRS